MVASTDYVFTPATLTIAVGDTVSWTFAGDPHTVTSGTVASGVPRPDGRFDSGIRQPGESYMLGPGGAADPFTSAGTYPYYCAVHPEQMTGTIVVVAASAQPTTQAQTAAPTSAVTAPPASSLPTSAPPSPPPLPSATPSPSATPAPAGGSLGPSVIAALVVLGSLAIGVGYLAWRGRAGRSGR